MNKKIESLVDILKSIFGENSYQVTDYSNALLKLELDDYINVECSFFADLKVQGKANYFFIISLSNYKELTNILRIQGHLANYLKYKVKEKDLEKNISLIICLKKEQGIEALDINKVLEIEEDPYYFKKYILDYTQSELEQLIENYFIKQENIRIEDILLNIISDNNMYERYRKKQKNGQVYSLVSKIYMKIPFLKLKINQKSSLISLQKDIDESLDEKDLLSVKNIMLEKSWGNYKDLYDSLKSSKNNEGESK